MPTSAPAVGNTVVAYSDMLNTVDAEIKLSDLKPGEPSVFVEGCKLGKAPDTSAVIQCLKRGVLLKFNCRDHTGRDHALGLMVGAWSYTVYCR